jgi:hypothetical protein
VGDPRILASDEGRWTRINRTKIGLLLVATGIVLEPAILAIVYAVPFTTPFTFLSVIPFSTWIGFALGIVGTTLVVSGRAPFGKRHSSRANTSLIVIVCGVALALSVDVAVRFLTITSVPQSFIFGFDYELISVSISGPLLGIAYVLLTYDLQDSTGRFFLYLGYAINLVIVATTGLIIGPQTSKLAEEFSGQRLFDLPLLRVISNESEVLTFLGIIAAGIYLIAYFHAYSRIRRLSAAVSLQV